MVVLIDQGTASAAELLTGALQDHDRALIVGEPSWGKCLLQTVYPLSYGFKFALTTSRWFTPSGRLIQRPYDAYFDYFLHKGAGVPAKFEKAEAFHTDLGRKVFGGGGITPDVTVEAESLSSFETLLMQKSAFQGFALDHEGRHRVDSADWQPTLDVVEEFRRWLVAERIAGADEVDAAFEDGELHARALSGIRAEMLNVAFGRKAHARALNGRDPQIKAARDLFDRAAELLAQRRRLD